MELAPYTVVPARVAGVGLVCFGSMAGGTVAPERVVGTATG